MRTIWHMKQQPIIAVAVGLLIHLVVVTSANSPVVRASHAEENGNSSASSEAEDSDAPADTLPAEQAHPADLNVETSQPIVKSMLDADRAAALKSAIEADTKRLEELRKDAGTRESEFKASGEAYDALNTELEAKQQELKTLTGPDDTDKANAVRIVITELTKKVGLAKERFDLVIQGQKSVKENIAIIEKKIDEQQGALDKLKGIKDEAPDESSPQGSVDESTKEEKKDEASSNVLDEIATKDVLEVRAKRKSEEEDVKEVETQLASVAERKNLIKEALEVELKNQDIAHKLAQNAGEHIDQIKQQIQEKTQDSSPQGEIDQLQQQLSEFEVKLRRANDDLRESTDSVQDLRIQLLGMESTESQLEILAEKERDEARSAWWDELLVTAREYLRVRGPRLLVVFVVLVFVWWLLRFTVRRVMTIKSFVNRGDPDARDDRGKTISKVSDNIITLLLIVGGGILLLEVAGVPVVPLIGGAAVLGLAAAFAAQHLLRDYLHGFIMLMEDQYMLKDRVTINEKTGIVEDMTLRVTRLRDDRTGELHIIPNGSIGSMTNHSHEWGRAICDVKIDFDENPDEVIQALLAAAAELRKDPEFAELITDDPDLTGVTNVDDSTFTVEVGLKTLPRVTRRVRWELLRRAKKSLSDIGVRSVQQRIELEYPNGSSQDASGLARARRTAR